MAALIDTTVETTPTMPIALFAAMFEVPRPAGSNTGSFELATLLLESFKKHIISTIKDEPASRTAIAMYALLRINIDAVKMLHYGQKSDIKGSIQNEQLLRDAEAYAASVDPLQLAPFVEISNEPMAFFGAQNCEDEITFLEPEKLRIHKDAGHVRNYPEGGQVDALRNLASQYGTDLVSYNRLKMFTPMGEEIMTPFTFIMKKYLGVDELPLSRFDNVPFIRRQIKDGITKYIFKGRLCRAFLNRKKSVSFPVRVTRKMCVEYNMSDFITLLEGESPAIRPRDTDEAYHLYCTYLAPGVRAGINNKGLQIEIENPVHKYPREMHMVAAYIRSRFYTHTYNIKTEDNYKKSNQ